ncbi:MAG: PTS transporter subunit EIIC [Oscillospiraceae bacterium]|jgi:glucose-like phosphotransferase system IIB component|nr:PTS transporter subunit EIIC [Oscillospiraceae bacterium]
MQKENALFKILQNIGRSFMLPIALLPIAGLLLGIGASFSNPQTVISLGLERFLGEGTFLNAVLIVMSKAGNVIFGNLPIIFAIGIAIGMAEREKSAAALSSAIAFLTMHQAVSSILELSGKISVMPSGSLSNVCGITSLNMGIFGGLIVGIGVSLLHNRFYKIKLPDMISFFGGVRFIPIISSIVYIFVGILLYFIWPFVQNIMFSAGGLVTKTGYFGTFIYGVIERALIPFGLHHVFYTPFWFTELGGTELINGHEISGAFNIFFAQLASPNVTKFSIDAARFLTGKFTFMMFGLPGAALAMFSTAKTSKKKAVGGLLLSAALTSFITGITEPIEFTFLFTAPILYGIHCLMAGLSFLLMHLFRVAIGTTFSCGLIDFLLFGVMQGNSKTNWLSLIPVGMAYFVIYYFLFRIMIEKMNFITPGREEDELESKLYTRKDFNAVSGGIAETVVLGLGGAENILDLGCCATRLRITVNEGEKIDKEILKSTGASGVLVKGRGVQIVYGPRVTVIKSEIEEYLQQIPESIKSN